MSRLVFDAYSIGEIVPPEYDPHMFYHRYRNGTGADALPEFSDARKQLEPILSEGPHTADELRRKLGIPLNNMVRILDFLFTHTAEIAALEVPKHDTLYIWADAEVAEKTRQQLATGGIRFESESITPEDIPALTAYLTNLLVLRPSIQTLDRTIEQTQRLLDAYRLKRAIQKTEDDQGRIALLTEKLQQLKDRRQTELERWQKNDQESSETAGAANRTDNRTRTGRANQDKVTTAASEQVEEYPYATLYLLGSGYNYSGPEREKRMTWRDPALNRIRFPHLKKIVVEMDTFFDDVDKGLRIHETTERVRSMLLAQKEVQLVYRRIPGITYPKRVAKRLHAETVKLIERGYSVLK